LMEEKELRSQLLSLLGMNNERGIVEKMAKAKIMIVEDEYLVAMSAKTMLNRLGYTVTAVVKSGEKAIEQAAETHPDLVLMDIILKGARDGIEAAGQIKSCFDIPVVYLTAHSEGAVLQRAKITEPYGYIIKPFDERTLNTTIEIALYKHEIDNALHESEEKYRSLSESLPDVVFEIDEEGKVTYTNTEGLVTFGYSMGDFLSGGLQLSDVIVESELDAARKNLSEIFR
jgi:CheY-like chemotaxis protein